MDNSYSGNISNSTVSAVVNSSQSSTEMSANDDARSHFQLVPPMWGKLIIVLMLVLQIASEGIKIKKV
jgi:hypothetical protein